jgi:quinone-modifying oxidoreductase, subunit QmoC
VLVEKWKSWNKIQYESDLDPGFSEEIASIPDGDKLYSCIQCGTCSGMCPLSTYMDYSPRQVIAMIRAGFRNDVLSSYTTWLCASCYACTVECPKEIKITDIMYAAKRLAISGGVYPKRFPSAVLAHEFFKGVEKTGRSSETWLLVKLFLRTNPFGMFKQTFLGLNLFRRGRLALTQDHIKHTDQLHTMLKHLEKESMITKRSSETKTPKEVA